MGVLADDVLLEKAEGPVVRRCGQADKIGVEILDNLPPQIVDGPMTFIDDDDIEVFGWQLGVVDNGQGIFATEDLFGRVLFFSGFVQRLPLQRRVHALDGGNHHLRVIRHRRRDQALDVVEFGELAIVVIGDEGHEFLFGLFAQIEEGLEARWARHERLADAVRAAVSTWATDDGIGFSAALPEQRSHAVTSIRTGSIDADALADRARERFGVTLGVGIGAEPGTSFRIGHMGHVNAPMVLGVLGVIETVVTEIGGSIGGSGVAAASGTLAVSGHAS